MVDRPITILIELTLEKMTWEKKKGRILFSRYKENILVPLLLFSNLALNKNFTVSFYMPNLITYGLC